MSEQLCHSYHADQKLPIRQSHYQVELTLNIYKNWIIKQNALRPKIGDCAAPPSLPTCYTLHCPLNHSQSDHNLTDPTW